MKALVTGGLVKILKYGPLSARYLNAEVLPAALPSWLSHAQPMWTICGERQDDIYTSLIFDIKKEKKEDMYTMDSQ